MTLSQRSTDFRSDDISVHHCRKKKGTRSVASCTLPPLCRSILSRLTNSTDILQGGPGRLHKKSPVTHMRKFAARASLIRSRTLCRPSLGCRARFHFSLSRERHPAVMRSFALLVDATMSFCSRGKPLRFPSLSYHAYT